MPLASTGRGSASIRPFGEAKTALLIATWTAQLAATPRSEKLVFFADHFAGRQTRITDAIRTKMAPVADLLKQAEVFFGNVAPGAPRSEKLAFFADPFGERQTRITDAIRTKMAPVADLLKQAEVFFGNVELGSPRSEKLAFFANPFGGR